MSKLSSVNRFGVFLLGVLWVLLSGLYGLIRFVVFIVGGVVAGLSAFVWVIGALFDVPDVRHYSGSIFLWTFGGAVLLILLGDLLFRRES